MKSTILGAAVLLAMLGWNPAWGADAAHPYTNVNHANDAGNDTGDSKVEALNQAQLSGNPPSPGYAPMQPQGAAPAPQRAPQPGQVAAAAPYPYTYAVPYPYYAPRVYYPAPFFPGPVYYGPRPYFYYYR
jgi:hypothetical protein